MDSAERRRLTDQSNTFRTDLKAWEKTFAASNNGKKASRDDIKQHPEIAAKYVEYNNIRDILSGKIPNPPPPLGQTPRKRKHDDTSNVGASKRLQLSVFKTPSKTPSKTSLRGSLRPWEVDPYDSPSLVRTLFTPSRTTLGPTPQKDGVVLGLFDLLEEGSSSKKGTNIRKKDIPVGATPRKPKGDIYETIRHSKTPTSVGKRYMLDSFATPLKNRTHTGEEASTPHTVSKLNLSATPLFLRRTQMYPPAPNGGHLVDFLSPQKTRLPRKPLVRGLSSILAGLRKIEEDAADEDLEALREMEASELGTKQIPTTTNPKSKTQAPPEESILVKDSQANFPLGGFDHESDFDSDPGGGDKNLGPDGQPLRVYKKKGQKRTTRRVKLKPTRSAPSKPSKPHPVSESEDELAGSSSEMIPETQVTDDKETFGEGRNFDSDTQSEYTASEGGTRYKRANQGKKNKGVNREGRVKTAARKVTALASQNFKRLKLRNTGAKGGPGVGSRFRRKK